MSERGMRPEGSVHQEMEQRKEPAERTNADAAQLASELVSYLETHQYSKDDKQLKALLQKMKTVGKNITFQQAEIQHRWEVPKNPTLDDYHHAVKLEEQWLSNLSSVSRGNQLYELLKSLEWSNKMRVQHIEMALQKTSPDAFAQTREGLRQQRVDQMLKESAVQRDADGALRKKYPDAVPGTIVEHDGERYVLVQRTENEKNWSYKFLRWERRMN